MFVNPHDTKGKGKFFFFMTDTVLKLFLYI